MRRIRRGFIVLSMLLCLGTPAAAEVSVGIAFPGVSIGINLPAYPELVPIPGYPAYYAPQLYANYFFYDGLYWLYTDDGWYVSYWYNGPWEFVEPDYVPLFILRIPVRYYRQPPEYFRGWHRNAPPRWGNIWGSEWAQRRRGWNRRQRGSAPPRAPLPLYQRQYPGERYPSVEQQNMLRNRQYRYQPRETIIREHFPQQPEQRVPAQRQRREEPWKTDPRPQELQRSTPPRQKGPETGRPQPPHWGDENIQRPAPLPQPSRQQPQGPAIHEQRRQPNAGQRERNAPPPRNKKQKKQDREDEPGPDRDHGHGRSRDEGQGHNN